MHYNSYYTYRAQFLYFWLYTKFIHTNSCLYTCTLGNNDHHIPPSFLTTCPFPSPPTPLSYLEFTCSSLVPPSYPTISQPPYIREDVRHLVFWDWLTSLSISCTNVIHFPANPMILLFFSAV